ncbi:hypothetical protein [Salinibacterium sp. NK8237]|uniref:hypothetical protein n=1 Tax=Salinibacterium sp. NK8237 TaxID=2792038 RepID=UPI0018CD8ED3|nr:hypothetical protein [Salinibacterium sp. NK8237]MBH0130060.1 hypothetical protein [Salinibacterium sp. NK8237]
MVDPAEASAPIEALRAPRITVMRAVLWVLVTGAGLFMVITGIVGVLVKAQ